MKEQEPKPMMQKTNDYRYPFQGYYGSEAVCRIRVYEQEGKVPVVIASELLENTGTSITNMAEFLAAEIIAKHFPQRFEEELPVHWVEHYEPERRGKREATDREYDLVTFATWTPKVEYRHGRQRVKLGTPDWHPSTKEAVEQLIEQPLDEEEPKR
jgi:hypothetical protein